MSIKVIHSAEEFINTFKVGDKFWEMGSMSGRGPIGIVEETVHGYVTINCEGDSHNGLTIVLLDAKSAEMAKDYNGEGSIALAISILGGTKHQYVDDIVNQWHGAFTNEADAIAYLAERKEAYKTDPILIQELEHERVLDEMMDNSMMGDDGDDY